MSGWARAAGYTFSSPDLRSVRSELRVALLLDHAGNFKVHSEEFRSAFPPEQFTRLYFLAC
jgi:hypothetical protein